MMNMLKQNQPILCDHCIQGQSVHVGRLIVLNMACVLGFNYIPRRKSGIYWIQVRRAAAAAAAAAAVEISLWTR